MDTLETAALFAWDAMKEGSSPDAWKNGIRDSAEEIFQQEIRKIQVYREKQWIERPQ